MNIPIKRFYQVLQTMKEKHSNLESILEHKRYGKILKTSR